MWEKSDSRMVMSWENALAWAQQKNNENYPVYNDWRIPDVKELQSGVHYNRSPQKIDYAAISSLFETTPIRDEGDGTNYPFY